MNEIQTIIKKYREEKLLTMQDLADALTAGSGERISIQSIQQWESGAHRPLKFVWIKIALKTDDWRRDMAMEVLTAMDPKFMNEMYGLLQGTEH